MLSSCVVSITVRCCDIVRNSEIRRDARRKQVSKFQIEKWKVIISFSLSMIISWCWSVRDRWYRLSIYGLLQQQNNKKSMTEHKEHDYCLRPLPITCLVFWSNKCKFWFRSIWLSPLTACIKTKTQWPSFESREQKEKKKINAKVAKSVDHSIRFVW